MAGAYASWSNVFTVSTLVVKLSNESPQCENKKARRTGKYDDRAAEETAGNRRPKSYLGNAGPIRMLAATLRLWEEKWRVKFKE